MSHCQHSESQIGAVGVPGRVWLLATLWTVTNQAPLSMRFPGKNTGVCCHFLLQGIFLMQGSNPRLRLGKWILYHRALGARRLESSHLLSIWPLDLLIFRVVPRPSVCPTSFRPETLFRIISSLLLRSGMGCELSLLLKLLTLSPLYFSLPLPT